MARCGLTFVVGEGYDAIQQQLSLVVKELELPVTTIQPSDKEYGKIAEFVRRQGLEGLVIVTDSGNKEIHHLKTLCMELGLDRNRIDFIRLTHYPVSNQETPKTLRATLRTLMAKFSHLEHLRFASRRTINVRRGVSRRRFLRFLTGDATEPLDTPVYDNHLCRPLLKGCDHCIEACEFAAIAKQEDRIIIDPELCMRCGACTAICPVGALQNPNLTDLQFRAAIDTLARNEDTLEEQVLVLTCDSSFAILSCRKERFPSGAILLELPCVAGLSPLHLYLASVGGINTLILCPDKTCALNLGARLAYESLKIVNATWESLGKTTRPLLSYVELEPTDSAKIVLSIKRSLASSVGYQGQASPYIGSRREMLLNILTILAHNASGDGLTEVSGSASPFYDLKVDGSCTLCGACAMNCPTSALDSSTSQGKEVLEFNPSRCVGCKVCLLVCPEEVLSVEKAFHPRRIVEETRVVKAEDEMVKCKKCGLPVFTKKTLERVILGLQAPGFEKALERVLLCQDCKQSMGAATATVPSG